MNKSTEVHSCCVSTQCRSTLVFNTLPWVHSHCVFILLPKYTHITCSYFYTSTLTLRVHTFTQVHSHCMFILLHKCTHIACSYSIGVHSVEIITEEQPTASQSQSAAPAPPTIITSQSVESNEGEEGDKGEDDEEPSVLQALSSEQLARRPSFKWATIKSD